MGKSIANIVKSEGAQITFRIIIIILVAIIINCIFSIILNILMKKNKSNFKAAMTSLKIIKRIKTTIIVVLTIIICIFQIPKISTISISILSGAGIASLILGYAAQKTLTNFFCGMGIAFSDPFEIGDYIKCVEIDLSGYVEDITLRHTVIRTVDNKRVIIPNGRMDEITIENYNHTDNEVCRFVEYPIAYTANADRALAILKEEMNKLYNPNTNGINKHVEFPKVRIVKWDSSGIVIRGWVWGADNSMTHEEIFNLNYIIKKRFDEENIEIPYNYINVIQKKDNAKTIKAKSQKKKAN